MRQIRIFLTLLAVTIAFVLYQNFGVIMHSEMNEVTKGMYAPKKHNFDPNKNLDHIEAFYSKNVIFVESENENSPKYFNHKKFLKDKWEQAPLYSRLKNWVEVSDTELEDASDKQSAANAAEEDGDIKIKVDPMKTKAMVRYIGSFNADVTYVQNESNVQVKVYKDLDSNSQIQLQHDASDEKTWIQYQLNW